MEIKIRGVSAVAINKIDDLARRKNVSRNFFLKTAIENFSLIKELEEMDLKFNNTAEKIADVLEHNTSAINFLIDKLGGY